VKQLNHLQREKLIAMSVRKSTGKGDTILQRHNKPLHGRIRERSVRLPRSEWFAASLEEFCSKEAARKPMRRHVGHSH